MLRAIASILFISNCLIAARSVAETVLPRQLAFYIVRSSPSLPGTDGGLPQDAWDAAPVASTYYEYWKSNPGVGRLKTEFRMLYSERGVHLQVTNFEDEGRAGRATIFRRDDPELWKDDCDQIYFDPDAKGIGFANFTVNKLGTQADMKRMDAAVTLPEWSGSEWSAVVRSDKHSWTLEAFFPWSDLGKKAAPGDIWMFNNVRFSWQDDALTGVTWAAGGNYANAKLFGYIYFAPAGEVPHDRLARILSAAATPPWMASSGDEILISTGKGDVRSLPAKEFVKGYQKEMEAALAKVEGLQTDAIGPEGSLAELRKLVAERLAVSDGSLQKLTSIIETTQLLTRTYWQSKINELLNDPASNSKNSK